MTSMEMVKVNSRPLSSKAKPDSFMYDSNEGVHRIEGHQIEEVKMASGGI